MQKQLARNSEALFVVIFSLHVPWLQPLGSSTRSTIAVVSWRMYAHTRGAQRWQRGKREFQNQPFAPCESHRTHLTNDPSAELQGLSLRHTTGGVLPWTKKKKEPSPRFAARRTLLHHVISCSIMRDQCRKKARIVGDDLALLWSLVIKHDITRSNSVLLVANLGDGSLFFFLSRVVYKAAIVSH